MEQTNFASLADCTACRVQGAVVETWAGEGAPATSRCRMCGRALEGGVEVQAAKALACVADVDAALLAWAREEGFATGAELVAAAFVLGDVGRVHGALILGEPVETSFDVMGYLFSHVGGASPGVAREDLDDPAVAAAGFVEASRRSPAPVLHSVDARSLDVRNELLALAAVAAADGAVVPLERAFLGAAARTLGTAPLAADELRVFRPDEVGPIGSLLDRERVLERMIACAFVDVQPSFAGGDLDDSEVRVIRSFARAWGVDPARVDGWLASSSDGGSLFHKLARKAARHLLPEA